MCHVERQMGFLGAQGKLGHVEKVLIGINN